MTDLKKSISIGHTFSHRQANHLNLDSRSCFNALIDLKPDYIRLCSYWSDIQPNKSVFELEPLTRFLTTCEEKNQSVVMTIGAKAPRWPEFYIPSWTGYDKESFEDDILNYLEKLVQALQKYTCISHWQVENEPLDPSGEDNKTISLAVLIKEIEQVKALDTRPVVTTMWGNNFRQRQLFSKLSSISDCVGIDLYYKQFITKVMGKSLYKGPNESDTELARLLNKSQKSLWIAELQAEPWEASETEYRADKPASMSPEILFQNFTRVKKLPVEAIFFWGFEYWFWQAQKGNNQYLDWYKKIILDR